MTTHRLLWLTMPMALLLAGCPSGGGGDGGLGSEKISVLYTANGSSNTLSGFAVDAAGILTAATPATVSASNAEWLTVSKSGRFLYASNQGNDTISGFSVNGSTGALTSVGPAKLVPGVSPSPRGITMTSSESFLYVANDGATNTVVGFAIGGTGTLTPTPTPTISTGETGARGIAASPTAPFLYVANSTSNSLSGFEIASDGTLSPISGSPVLTGPSCTNPEGLAISSNGSTLFVACRGTNRVAAYTIAPGTGVLAPALPLSSFPTGSNGSESPQRIVISPNGSFLYVTNRGTTEVAAFTIQGNQLAPITPSTPTGAGTSPVGITIDPSGQFLYVANSGMKEVAGFRINASGTLSKTSPATFSLGPTTTPIGIAMPGRP